eukprot:CAMPEP_0197866118 /NCGR_PEP_ID=MMETSP1438-20131217/44040_1 /TAXON_ID=1461541 /ORGANISM="Pterosperma sp., Strain CCMP1384" /LENGTH=392 /DNA_ID=CAMNT_0043484655 /DNA_START=467 /DNA_END=1641 /DNA_ORIENTATION=-
MLYTSKQLAGSRAVERSDSKWEFGALGKLAKQQEAEGVDKALDMFGDLKALASAGVAGLCKKGDRTKNRLKFGIPEDNQDNIFSFFSERYRVYGVFDGHGRDGGVVSCIVGTLMHNVLATVLLEDGYLQPTKPAEWDGFLKAVFMEVHAGMEQVASCEEDGFDIENSGTTATVVIHDIKNDTFYTANVGDSKAVLAHSSSIRVTTSGHIAKVGQKGVKGLKLIELTQRHQPDQADEMKRVREMGGDVVIDVLDDGTRIPRLVEKGTDDPGLAISRAFGDVQWKDIGMTFVPTVGVAILNKGGTKSSDDRNWILMMGSDGLWEFVSNQKAADMVSSSLDGDFDEDLRTEDEIRSEITGGGKLFGNKKGTSNIRSEQTLVGESVLQLYRAARLG